MIGQVLDSRYRILAKIAEGGMGEVYLVEHVNLGRKEALKVLRAHFASALDVTARLRREGRALNRLQHPNIVSVYELGRLPDGRFFLTMEYAFGETLHAVIRSVNMLPVGRALPILAQLADAVAHAHAAGVVHRDLKPANLILVAHRGRQDVLKVLDFGIAKIIAPDYVESVGVTRDGETQGTVEYMAPEQLQGTGDDKRSDLYAIGCIAFEMLTGEPPFVGRQMEVARAQLTEEPPRPSLRRCLGDIPPELDALILRCLEKRPERRFGSADELLAFLRKVPGFRWPSPMGLRGELARFPGEQDSTPGRSSSSLIAAPPVSVDHAAPTVLLPTARNEGVTRKLPAQPMKPIDHGAPTVLLGVARIGSGEPRPLRDARVEETAEGPPETERQRSEPLHLLLREVAEALLDLGHSDVSLVVGLAALDQLEEDLRSNESDLAATESRAQMLEDAARRRAASLRFSLGDLHQSRAGMVARSEPVAPDLDKQIASMERRLAGIDEQLERDIGELADRLIALTADRAALEERLFARYSSLEKLIDELLADAEPHPLVVPYIHRLERVRESTGNH